ncbi:MAG TPA: peptide-N4-asparagine amidase [Acidobacteriaceae bacterium]
MHVLRAPRSFRPSVDALLVGAALCFATAPFARAQVVVAPTLPQVGSSNPVSAEPGVKRPSTQPCTVTLFSNLEFADYNNKTFAYTPPAGCGSGPWAKVVLTADLTVTAGRQYDRTAEFYIGGANVYFGTTAEPRKTLSPSWHVERDITDLSALLRSSQTGIASIGNFVGVSGGVTYDGIIYASAALEFYPANLANLPLPAPDVVLPMPGGTNTTYTLNSTSDVLAATFSLPRNIEAAYLDVISQSQGGDEFWYTCSPNEVAAELGNCGNTGFRETEISIDGKPAGIAPVYPWIYTGGIDPYLWEPTVGVQTLDFKPYRVDLTPFAGMLSDGNPHTVGVSVLNADGYFADTATLLLFLDHGSQQTTGELTNNTLPQPTPPYVKNDYQTSALGEITGNSLVVQQRTFNLAGYVNTSHGRVQTSIDETVDFANYQTIVDSSIEYLQTVAQASGAYSVTHTKDGPLDFETDRVMVYPFTFTYDYQVNADGSFFIASQVNQQDYSYEKQLLDGFTYYTRYGDENVNSSDTLNYAASGALSGHTGSSTAYDQQNDSLGSCYSRQLTAADTKLTAVLDGAACGGTNKQ